MVGLLQPGEQVRIRVGDSVHASMELLSERQNARSDRGILWMRRRIRANCLYVRVLSEMGMPRGQEQTSLDAKRTDAGNRLHRLELEPGLLETDRREQCEEPCADLLDLALCPGPDGLEDDGNHSPGLEHPPYLLYSGLLIRPERQGIRGERYIERGIFKREGQGRTWLQAHSPFS